MHAALAHVFAFVVLGVVVVGLCINVVFRLFVFPTVIRVVDCPSFPFVRSCSCPRAPPPPPAVAASPAGVRVSCLSLCIGGTGAFPVFCRFLCSSVRARLGFSSSLSCAFVVSHVPCVSLAGFSLSVAGSSSLSELSSSFAFLAVAVCLWCRAVCCMHLVVFLFFCFTSGLWCVFLPCFVRHSG